jgi:hypothetical protein
MVVEVMVMMTMSAYAYVPAAPRRVAVAAPGGRHVLKQPQTRQRPGAPGFISAQPVRMAALGRGSGKLGAGEGGDGEGDGDRREFCASAGAPVCPPLAPCLRRQWLQAIINITTL